MAQLGLLGVVRRPYKNSVYNSLQGLSKGLR